MIYTTYFGKLNSRDFDKTKFTPIAICAKPPEGWAGKCFSSLAPHYDFFMQYKKDVKFPTFSEHYNAEVLAKLDPSFVGHQLLLMADAGRSPVMVCYEKNPAACHRSLVAAWLRQNGFEVEEV